MNKEQLLEYIKNRNYWCPFCLKLQSQVKEHGLKAIDDWVKHGNIICGSIEDMILRKGELND